MISFKIDSSEVQQALADINKYKREVVEGVKRQTVTSTFNIRNEAFDKAPRKTTYLASSIKSLISGNKLLGEVSANAEYAEAVEKGTKPHVIRAKNKPLLKFQVGGQWVSKKSVNHPGTKAQPFMEPAFEKEKPIYINKILTLIRK